MCLILLIIASSSFWKCLKQRPVLGFFGGEKPKIETPSVLIIKHVKELKQTKSFVHNYLTLFKLFWEPCLFIYQTQLFDSSKTMVMNHKDCPW
jgi:hypothetical protein